MGIDERAILPVRAVVAVYATLAHLQRTGTWSWGGMSADAVWLKCVRVANRAHADETRRDGCTNLLSTIHTSGLGTRFSSGPSLQ